MGGLPLTNWPALEVLSTAGSEGCIYGWRAAAGWGRAPGEVVMRGADLQCLSYDASRRLVVRRAHLIDDSFVHRRTCLLRGEFGASGALRTAQMLMSNGSSGGHG